MLNIAFSNKSFFFKILAKSGIIEQEFL
jgi:hypothetical protein